jgi:hypothetical protein
MPRLLPRPRRLNVALRLDVVGAEGSTAGVGTVGEAWFASRDAGGGVCKGLSYS